MARWSAFSDNALVQRLPEAPGSPPLIPEAVENRPRDLLLRRCCFSYGGVSPAEDCIVPLDSPPMCVYPNHVTRRRVRWSCWRIHRNLGRIDWSVTLGCVWFGAPVACLVICGR